jgi:hypothetical protein
VGSRSKVRFATFLTVTIEEHCIMFY